jgi:2,4-dienoyl-CoA reductase-like NADH-dependent reductase (Old Yellow Enzyme family)
VTALRGLFQPVAMGKVELKNRIVMPALSTCFASDDGFVTDRIINHYVKRARGGVGLIVVEATYIDAPVGKCLPRELCVDDDQYIPGLSKLAEAVHRYGTKLALQIHHA